MIFESLTLMLFCMEKANIRKMVFFMFKQCFQWAFAWNRVKYARKLFTHVFFIALTLAESLGRCLNTLPNGLMFKQLHWDLANAIA